MAETKSFREKLDKNGPRKLLACDGGGIRGMISIEILGQIEAELRNAAGKPDLVLADYFDYVAGTSTGAIIATLVSLGFSRSATGFLSSKWRGDVSQRAPVGALSHEIEDDKLSKILGDSIGEDTTLGS